MIWRMVYEGERRMASTGKWIAGLMIALLVTVSPARAISLLRDAGAEYALRQLADPVLRAAGLSAAQVKILIVNDSSLNAFVISNDAIFINAGLLSRMQTAEMLQAVIAHEAAHIANGHITRRITNLGNARTAAGLGLALAALAAAAGGGEAAAGIAIGAQSAAQRRFLSHTRAEEASADQAALRYMRQAGVPTTGMLHVMDLFRGQEALPERRIDPYARSHPLSRDRLRAIEGFISAQRGEPAPSQKSAYWFARAKGKLTAFQRAPRWTLSRAGDSGFQDVALMRQAMAHHRNSNTRKALAAIDKAIALRPKDPFYHDLRGQILLETRNFAASVQSYGRAVNLRPRDAQLLTGYGRALLAAGQPTKARDVLERARSIDFRNGYLLIGLSQAYAKTGQTGMAVLVTAERYALTGRFDTALIHAKRASGLLPNGSGPWQRAQDVLLASERAVKKRR